MKKKICYTSITWSVIDFFASKKKIMITAGYNNPIYTMANMINFKPYSPLYVVIWI